MRNRRLGTQRIYRGHIINLRVDRVELPDGRVVEREVVEHPGAAVIVPVDGEGRLYMVRQYRDAAGEDMLELPAGKLQDGEDPEDCARRELREELGFAAGSLIHLATFYSSPGFCDELMHVYLARQLTREAGETDSDEFLEPETRSLDEAASLLEELRDAKSLAGILLAMKHMQ